MPFTQISLTELGDPKTMAVADVDSLQKQTGITANW